MKQKESINFDEPKTFHVAKAKFYYLVIALLVILGIMLFGKTPTPPICYGLLVLFAIYLFLPFTYRLLVSNEAISSINLLGTKTLAWNEIAEIRNKNGSLILVNHDEGVKVMVSQQIDELPSVIDFIKQQRPELWKADDIKAFHQGVIQSTLLGILGLLIIFWTVKFSLEDGFSVSQDLMPTFIGLFMGAALIWQAIKIREITFDTDYLIAKYVIGERRFHVNEIQSVVLAQAAIKEEVSYPVYIKLKNGKQLVIQKAKEGNPLLANAIEAWLERYGEK